MAAMSRNAWKCKILGSCLCDFSDSSGRDSYGNDDDADSEVVELDPTGRYCRYKEILGKGACKTVYKAFDEIDGMEVAWNQVNFHDALLTSEDLERVYSEVYLLKTLKHKNIIKYYHSWVDTTAQSLNFITEFFTSGTLRQYRNRHRHVNMKAVKNWSRQILCGLLYLHSHDPPIIHRDLKCDNIFVNGNQGEVKIGDLGLATILQKAHLAHGVIGTPEFMAPELYEEEYTELVDIYSFGMCLLEMVTFQYPYTECTNAAQIFKKVTSGKKPEALNKVTDLDLRYFIEKCLATASERMSVRDLLMDPFLLCDDGNGETINYSSLISPRVLSTEDDDMDDKGLGDVLKSNIVKISYGPMESFSSLSSDNSYESALMPFSSHHVIGKLGGSVGIEVKGRKGEDDTMFLRLRISDCEGCIHNIHFPFDVEGDTAMSVATEMVAELDLSNQDVTKIADMIDAAILFLVPEWKPGVAIDNETNLLFDGIPSPDLFFDADKFEEEILAEEERLLISKQEQELKDLHWKHEEALIELKRKWLERRYLIPVASM